MLICPRCHEKLNNNILKAEQPHCHICKSNFSHINGFLSFIDNTSSDKSYMDIGEDTEFLTQEDETTRQRFKRYFIPLFNTWKIDRNAKILCVGCGDAADVYELKKNGFEQSYGLDMGWRSKWWKIKKREPNYLFIANAENMPFEDKFFDIIIALGVIEHIGAIGATASLSKDFIFARHRFITNILRVMKDKGKLIIACPNRTFPIDFQHNLSSIKLLSRFAEKTGICFHSPLNKFLLTYKDIAYYAYIKEPICIEIKPLPVTNYLGLTFRNSIFLRPFSGIFNAYLWVLDKMPAFIRKSFLNPYMICVILKKYSYKNMKNFLNKLTNKKYLLFLLFFEFCCSFVFGKIIDIYPGHKIKKENSLSSFFQIRWADISPGDAILLYDDYGPYREPFIILGKGTPEKPIVIKAADGEKPVIQSSVIFTNAKHIILENITIANHFERGIIIREGSHNITVKNCVVKNNGLGIWIGGYAGMNNKIINNEVFSNETHGIAIDVVNCKQGSETLIAGNRVYNNGHHGMEINGSYYIIEENEVFNNGLKHLGCTGIHTYAKDAEQDAGDHNIIRYNVCYRNRDTKKFDGNGIQLDQWCDYNEVYYNICYENDGAGICIFDSSNSKIYNNTLFNNAIDSGKSHQIKAELVIASDFTKNVDHTNNISVFNNIVVANNKNVYALYVDRLSSDNKLSINNNLFYNLKSDKFYIWNDRKVGDINKVKSRNAKINDNLSDNPLFIKKIPAEINSFRLQENSPCVGKGTYTGQKKDILGHIIPEDENPSLGAIHHNSGDFQ